MTVNIPRSLSEMPVSEIRWIGQPMRRVEDPLLVTGRAEFTDNIALPGMLHAAFLGSPHAHARIKRIDVSEAEKMPGVVAIVTGEDAIRWTSPPHALPDGWNPYILATDKVCYVGEPVVGVAAASRYIAEDALDRIVVEYEPLPAVIDARRALDPDSPLVRENKGTNLIWHNKWEWGDPEKAFREADHVFTEQFRWNRISGNALEGMSGIAQWNTLDDSLTMMGAYQIPVHMVGLYCSVLGIPPNKFNCIAHPTGGSFGGRGGGWLLICTALMSRKSGGRPVKFVMDRREHLVTSQTWDRHYEVSVAARKDGTLTGLKVKLLDNFGADQQGSPIVNPIKPLACFAGPYAIRDAEYEVTCVATNKSPQNTFRGAGPPPHNLAVENALDIAARGLGIDPTELRRRNFIRPEQLPYTTLTGVIYDSGNYEATLNKVLEMADYPALRRYQEEAREQGRLVGIGVVTTIEPGGIIHLGMFTAASPFLSVPFSDGACVRIDASGKVTVEVGFSWVGQGQYTFVTQLLADYFCVPPSDVRVVMLDTASCFNTAGPGGSRSAVTLTGAVLGAADLLRQKLVKVAANVLRAAPEDVELMDGRLRVKGKPGAEMTVAQVVGIILYKPEMLPPDVDGSPEATYVYDEREWSKPGGRSYLTSANACHLVLLEVDPKTGKVEILKYYMADDCGTRLNPANVEGIHQGALAQGVGIALLEENICDENGQNVTSTLMDYLLPTINEVPMAEQAALCTPSPFSPLGAKGTGEGAIHTTPAAVTCAINDALAPLGVRSLETPASPLRLWKLVQEAQQRRSNAD